MHISYLSLSNKLPTNLGAYIYYLTVSVNQESRNACLWLKVSLEVVIKLQARASRLEGNLLRNSLTWLLTISFPCDYWPDGIFFHYVGFCRAANDIASHANNSKERKLKMEAQSFTT